MSKDFITRKQLIEKMKYTGNEIVSSDMYATRSVCETAGADPTYLASYGYDQYPIDDDVILGIPDLRLSNVTITNAFQFYNLNVPFDCSKVFAFGVNVDLSVGYITGRICGITESQESGSKLLINIISFGSTGLLMQINTMGGTIDGIATESENIVLVENPPTPVAANITVQYIPNMGLYVGYNGKQVYNKGVKFGSKKIGTISLGIMPSPVVLTELVFRGTK